MKNFFYVVLLIAVAKTEDFQLSVSNKSMDFIYSLLPVFSPLFKDKEFDGFAVIDIDYFIKLQLQVEKMTLHSLELNKSRNSSLQQINENEYILTFPELSIEASCEVKVTKGMFQDLGDVDLSIKKFVVQVLIEFKETEEGELLMVAKNYNFQYEEFQLDIENQFISYIWRILADHDFIKKYVMKKIGQKISTYIEDINLYQIAQFKLADEVFIFGLSEKPLLIDENDEFFIVTKIDLTKVNTISSPLEQNEYQNLMFSAKISKISQLIKLVGDNKKLILNNIKPVADKLTVQNLQLAFPELASLYQDKMNAFIQVELALKFDKIDPLINRDLNTFMFQKIEINLREVESKKQICTLQLDSFLNLMINSSDIKKSLLYVNMPSMRIVELEAKDCLFDVQVEQYKNILENLFRINLLGKRKYSFEDYQSVITGPYVYTKNDRFYFGLNVELDL